MYEQVNVSVWSNFSRRREAASYIIHLSRYSPSVLHTCGSSASLVRSWALDCVLHVFDRSSTDAWCGLIGMIWQQKGEILDDIGWYCHVDEDFYMIYIVQYATYLVYLIYLLSGHLHRTIVLHIFEMDAWHQDQKNEASIWFSIAWWILRICQKIRPKSLFFFEWKLTIPLNLKIHFALKMGGCIAP